MTLHAIGRRQQGFALIIVLWLLMLLTVIASSHAQNIRIETQLASQQTDAARARARAAAGVYRTIMELFVAEDAGRQLTNGTPINIEFDGGSLDIVIRDASGLVDLNTVQPALLDAVLAGAGVPGELRAALVDATLDWRDRDDLKRLHGAEAEEYRQAGVAWRPHNGPFSDVEEFRYVLGVSSEIFEQLAPYLTTHSGHQGVDPDYAPPWLAGVLAETQQQRPPAKPSAAGGAARTRPSVYHIGVKSRTTGGAVASLEVVVRVSNTREQPYTILSWREPGRSLPADLE